MPNHRAESVPRCDPLRVLQRRFLFGMAAVAVLVILNQLVLQPWLIQLTSDAPVINVAGRQRMLSQKLSKTALELIDGYDEETTLRELRQALKDWSTAHRGLQFGDDHLGLPPNEDDKIKRAFTELDPHFRKMQTAVSKLIAPGLSDAERRAEVNVVLAEEKEYLPRMHAIVGMFESESRARVGRLRMAGWFILGVILLLLGLLIRFSLKPVMRAIEGRVALRTRRLKAMNRQLEREISERQHAESRTRELMEQLAHSSRLNSLGQMAAGLAHELNQPLGAIANYAEAAGFYLAEDRMVRPELAQTLEKISSASLRAGAIVHRLRGFVRKEKSHRELSRPEPLIDEVIELCQPEARRNDVRILFETPSASLPAVSADAVQVQQVLVNLIQNAIQAMEEVGAERRTIRISVSRDESELRIDVADRGRGFTELERDLLFEPFVTSRIEGLGMGLAICRSIVQEHGGRLWAVSSDGEGAVFSFTLPLQTADEPAAECVHR